MDASSLRSFWNESLIVPCFFFLFLSGIFNTAFTKYVVEEPTSVVNMGAMTAAAATANGEQTPSPQASAQSNIKETEL